MLVKCRYCGIKLDREEAFKVVVGGKNTYYCNKTEYEKVIYKKKLKDTTYDCINEIFGYKVLNSALFKEINILLEVYSYEHILGYLTENKEFLSKILNKEFNSEYAKIRYFSAIIKNSIADFKIKRIKSEYPKEVEVDIPTIKYKRKNKRRPLCEIEEQVGD